MVPTAFRRVPCVAPGASGLRPRSRAPGVARSPAADDLELPQALRLLGGESRFRRRGRRARPPRALPPAGDALAQLGLHLLHAERLVLRRGERRGQHGVVSGLREVLHHRGGFEGSGLGGAEIHQCGERRTLGGTVVGPGQGDRRGRAPAAAAAPGSVRGPATARAADGPRDARAAIGAAVRRDPAPRRAWAAAGARAPLPAARRVRPGAGAAARRARAR